MATYLVTYDVQDGAREISFSEEEVLDERTSKEAVKDYFEKRGKHKYGDKFIKVVTIANINDGKHAEIIYKA